MNVCRRAMICGLGLSVVLLLGACAKKNTSVQGAAGLSDGGRSEQTNGASSSGQQKADLSAGLREKSMSSQGEKGRFSDQGSSKESMMKNGSSLEEKSLSAAAIAKEFLPIFFEYDRAVLKRASKMRLQENARLLLQYPETRVAIEGHTDERGSNEYNLTLGARRARSVMRFLMALGVEAGRLRIISFGEEKPFCSERKESCWQLNRRAHFVPQS